MIIRRRPETREIFFFPTSNCLPKRAPPARIRRWHCYLPGADTRSVFARLTTDHGPSPCVCLAARQGHVHDLAALWLAAGDAFAICHLLCVEHLALPTCERRHRSVQTGRAGILRHDAVWLWRYLALLGTWTRLHDPASTLDTTGVGDVVLRDELLLFWPTRRTLSGFFNKCSGPAFVVPHSDADLLL